MPFDFVASAAQRRFLPARATLQLDDAEGTVVSVASGSLWLTMENDTRDVVLTPGMRFEVDRSGRTIIAAEEDTRVALMAPETRADGIAARVARKLAAFIDRRARPKPSGFVPYY